MLAFFRFCVVICFQISIFEPLETTFCIRSKSTVQLWFAFKLVSLNHWKQRKNMGRMVTYVVICFQISIFEPLETTFYPSSELHKPLWFAFKLVSLNHWKKLWCIWHNSILVVICFQISIFEPLETTVFPIRNEVSGLWFAFKLVSLNHWKHLDSCHNILRNCCDLLSN